MRQCPGRVVGDSCDTRYQLGSPLGCSSGRAPDLQWVVLMGKFVFTAWQGAWHLSRPLRKGLPRHLSEPSFPWKTRNEGRGGGRAFSLQPNMWTPCVSLKGILESSCTLHWDQTELNMKQASKHYKGNRALINPESCEPNSVCSVGVFLEHHKTRSQAFPPSGNCITEQDTISPFSLIPGPFHLAVTMPLQ